MDAAKRWGYWLALAVVIVAAGWLRVAHTDTSREILVGDETTYWHAAKSIIDHGTLIRDVDGSQYRGEVPALPTAALSPGYPLFIAAIIKLGGGVSTVLTANIALSVMTLLLMGLVMRQLKLGPVASIIALAAAAAYPGFVSNLDRMLTEQLFLTLFLGFVYCALRGMLGDRPWWTLAAAVMLGVATHVRAQALPFAALAAAFIFATVPAERVARHLVMLVSGVLLVMLPWWIRNFVDFGRLVLLTQASEGAAIWGAVPYFIDMGSSAGTLTEVVSRNMPPAPDVYYRWRVFGFLQFMWGDVWDERLAHPVRELRKLMLLHPLTVVLPILLAPLVVLRRNLPALFVAIIPLAFTVLALPFHGLPRYALPAVPFAFITLAVLLSPTPPIEQPVGLMVWQELAQRWLRVGFVVATVTFSIVLAYSLGVFALDMSQEMSRYRLARYMGTRIDQLGAPVSETVIDLKAVPVENAEVIAPGRLFNNVDAPAIIKLDIPRLGGERVVTEVQLDIKGGFYFDKTTIYWKGAKTPEISENAYYSYPTNPLRTGQTVYIDDDVDHLMIVPFMFRWAKFDADKVVVRKYRAP